MAYALQIGSASPVDLATLNITSAVHTENCEGETFLEITIPLALNSASPIAPFEKCILWDTSVTPNQRRFIGWLDSSPRKATASSEEMVFQLTGGQRWLQRQYASQNFAGFVVIGGTARANTNDVPALAFGNVVEGLVTQVSQVLGPSAASVNAAFGHTVPIRYRSDVSVWDALNTVMTLTPDAVLRWTYPSSTQPLLNIYRKDSTTAVDVTLNASVYQLTSATLNPRYDLLADSVNVYYMDGDSIRALVISGPAGDAATLGANRTLVFTQDVTAINNVPNNLAAEYLASWYQRLHIDGSVSKQSIDWSDYAGMLCGFSGTLFSQFTSYKTLATTLKRDLFHNTTDIDLGVLPQKVIYKLRDYDQPNSTSGDGRTTYSGISTPFSASPSSGASYTNGTSTSSINPSQIDTPFLNTADISTTDLTSDNITTDTLTVNQSSEFGGNLTGSGGGGFTLAPSSGDFSTDGKITAQGDIVTDGKIRSGTDKAEMSQTGAISGTELKIASSLGGTPVSSIDSAGKGKFTDVEITGTLKVGNITYTALEIERCDGKKVKILADQAGWV